ncbi:ATP-binding cassette domain-containing protein [Proteiniclasticum ruminis]|uniref:Monosaccharide ABC transporter ATP-binding protein, CUT2 family n=1 Tax=Proteiniclasticum ruminis TaxID=398199 RepID=A0A1I5BWH2_9CLOT|nr:ATP-binding cassette domain-containing protein [Proteiniclasticum ruminis]SFN78995.1 monosaccharide ABC transporter ATP-binding protein, CUT2 family [Proteiniclasticum ruminis]
MDEILRMEHVTKKVDGVLRLDNLHFHVLRGEIMGMIPLNYHGKKELIRLLTTNNPIDMGRIYIGGQLVNYYEHSDMGMNQVEIIDVHSRLVEDLTVADNIFVLSRSFGESIISKRKLHADTENLLASFAIEVKTDDLAMKLNHFQRSVIELIKYVRGGAKLILLDEISSYLSTTELQKFQTLMKYFADTEGTSFLYFANHHEEAFKICHRVCLMEDGKVVKMLEEEHLTDQDIAPYIISFDLPYERDEEEQSLEVGLLEFRQVFSGELENLSFRVEHGECLTILDMDNSSLEEILMLVQGKTEAEHGKILYEGFPLVYNRGEDSIDKGIAVIEENPKESMIFRSMDYYENLTFLLDRKLNRSIVPKKIRKNLMEEYEPYVGKECFTKNIKEWSTRDVYNLAYYRIHLFRPSIVFLIQPFSNADMYLRAHIITLINKLRQRGITIVILAVSIQDSLSVSDRLVTIEKGSFTRIYPKEDFYRFQR